MINENTHLASRIGFFFAGALLGGATALLLAPQSGRRTRRMLLNKANDSVDRLSEAGRDFTDRCNEFYEKSRKLAKSAAAGA